VEQIRRAGERAAGLTQQLLAFSRRQTLRPEVVNINAIVGEYVSLLARVLGEHVVLETAFGADLPAVKADPVQLGQVVMNLAVNARDAMPDGGTLRIETATDESGAVNVIVSDTGQGIEPEIRERIFEPFYTTKEPGSGTGLGLATVLGIVEQSGGTIDVSSEPGQGARFVVRLPATTEVTEPPAQEPPPATPARAATILLVEDEDVVRELVATILEEEGYDVVTAASPRQALRLAEATHPDLLLTDVVMPEMNGMELARRVLEQYPGIAVLYTSGYAADVVTDRNVLGPTDAFIQKPYPAAALTDMVRRLLETHSRPNRELSSMKKTASAA
jgi:two-component system cell cycle sensor histidine kinase/response regulator CckA